MVGQWVRNKNEHYGRRCQRLVSDRNKTNASKTVSPKVSDETKHASVDNDRFKTKYRGAGISQATCSCLRHSSL